LSDFNRIESSLKSAAITEGGTVDRCGRGTGECRLPSLFSDFGYANAGSCFARRAASGKL